MAVADASIGGNVLAAGSKGYDISFPQCVKQTGNSVDPNVNIAQANYVILGLDDLVTADTNNPCFRSELDLLRNNKEKLLGLYVLSSYTAPAPSPSPGQTAEQYCEVNAAACNAAYLAGFNLGANDSRRAHALGVDVPEWWIDTEEYKLPSGAEAWPDNGFINQRVLDGQNHGISQTESGYLHEPVSVGYYSVFSPYEWGRITSNWANPELNWLVVSNASNASEAQAACTMNIYGRTPLIGQFGGGKVDGDILCSAMKS